MLRRWLLIVAVFSLAAAGCDRAPVSPGEAGDFLDFSMEVNSTLRMEAVDRDRMLVPSGGEGMDGVEIYDCWLADGGGWVWYTPEEYEFNSGDTIETVVFFTHDEICNIKRTDAFYKCGETNWRNFLMTNVLDFGTMVPPPPGYGWITGIGYIAPSFSDTFCLGWTSKVDCNDSWDFCFWPPVEFYIYP